MGSATGQITTSGENDEFQIELSLPILNGLESRKKKHRSDETKDGGQDDVRGVGNGWGVQEQW